MDIYICVAVSTIRSTPATREPPLFQPTTTMDWFINHPFFIEERLADRRARVGVFILEDLGVKRALEEEGIEVRRIRGEREVRIVLPENWSLVRTGGIGDKCLHFICNPQMKPIFATFSAHYMELPSRGWVKRVEDCHFSEDYPIILGEKVNIETLKVNEEYYDGYESVLIWEKLPGVHILCTLDRKPVCEVFYRYPSAFVRKRDDEESYTIGKIEETEDDEKDYDGPQKTHKYTISQREEDFVRVEEFLHYYGK